MFKNLSNTLTKISAFLFVALPLSLFGNGESVLGKFKGEFETQITSTASDIASMVNTFITAIGILWIVILGVILIFNKEQAMQHIKGIIMISVVLGIIWGISNALI